jgi:hypothetical protein
MGGRRLFSKNIKIIVIRLTNKRFIFLENNLFIFNLEYILVLAKKLIGDELIEEFD